MTTDGELTVGFVLEQSLGHVTHADNLRAILGGVPGLDARWCLVPFEVRGAAAKLPLYRSNWTVRAGLRARRAIAELRAAGPLDALLIHTQVPAVLAVDVMRRVPTVVSLDATPLQYDAFGEQYAHDAGPPAVERLKWRANRRCLLAAAGIVAWSAWARDGLADGYGIDPAGVEVVPPGVRWSQWATERREAAPGDPVRVLFVGGDCTRKGGDVLVEAVRRLRAQGGPHDVSVDLVTRTPVPEEPGVRVHRGLGPNSPELIELYRRADVFCLPTRGDCLPMVLPEAGASGLPLVSTAVGAIPEIVRDGETGLLVPPGDAEALAVALGRLAADPALRSRLGGRAADLVRREHDAERNAHRLVDLLRARSASAAPHEAAA